MNIMKQALGKQWNSLPPVLQAHYQDNDNKDIGKLSVEYPAWMQPFLNGLHLFGALLNRQGQDISTEVSKKMQGNTQCWHRTMTFEEGKNVYFKSRWNYAEGNKLEEYVNSILGLRMSVEVREDKLYYEGEKFIIKLGKIKLPLPEWLLLGHTTIIEEQVDPEHFKMDFRLTHPLFGEVYRYTGTFCTRTTTRATNNSEKGAGET